MQDLPDVYYHAITSKNKMERNLVDLRRELCENIARTLFASTASTQDIMKCVENLKPSDVKAFECYLEAVHSIEGRISQMDFLMRELTEAVDTLVQESVTRPEHPKGENQYLHLINSSIWGSVKL